MATNSQVLRNRANNMMTGFSAGQRMVVGIAVLTIVVGGVFFAQWASKPTMVPLFSNLSSEDASAITAKLQSAKTQYELTDGGATILVPQAKVYQTRLDMAGANLPNGGSSGYTLLDKQGVTTSDFLEHVNYQRALEGEIGKTVAAIDGVQGASIHLVIPQTDVFAQDSEKPSASVLVKTGNGKSLSTGEVKAIVNLVASSVQGLSTDAVTVADDKGHMLAAPGQDIAGGPDGEQATQTSAVENDLNAKIQNLLTPVMGAGKAAVQAKADLNFDKIKQTQDVYNPNNKNLNPSSSSIKTEVYGSGTSPVSTGCLGAGVQVTSTECAASSTTTGTAGANGYSTVNQTQDNLTDRTVIETEKTPGAINRISVAVLLDSNVPNIDEQQITDLVTQAAGLQPSRGDSVVVTRMAFDKTTTEAAAKELSEAAKAKKSEQTMSLIKSAATVVIILAVLALLFVTTKKKAKSYTSTPISLAELDAAMPALPSADEMLAGLESQALVDNSPEALERAKVDKEITNLIEKQPDEVASLLRSWLADRRS